MFDFYGHLCRLQVMLNSISFPISWNSLIDYVRSFSRYATAEATTIYSSIHDDPDQFTSDRIHDGEDDDDDGSCMKIQC